MARMGAQDAASLIDGLSDQLALDVLQRVNPSHVSDLLPLLPDERRERLYAAGPKATTSQWKLNLTFAADSIGRLMEPATGVFKPTESVAETSARVKELVKKIFITYCFVCDDTNKLVGIVTMRDLLVSSPTAKLSDIMLKDPFALKPATPLVEAMKQVLNRHFPIYPVTDIDGKLVG